MSKLSMTLIAAIVVISVVLLVNGAESLIPICPKGYVLWDQRDSSNTVCFRPEDGVLVSAREVS